MTSQDLSVLPSFIKIISKFNLYASKAIIVSLTVCSTIFSLLKTGIIIENSETRSQLENKEKAMQLLRSQLYELEMRKLEEEKQKTENNKKKIEWGSQIRNYVLHPYKLVKDLRTDVESTNPNAVLDGDINNFLKSYLLADEKDV